MPRSIPRLRIVGVTTRAALLFGGLALALSLFVSHLVFAEDDGSVWSATRQWSTAEEERYAEWIENEVDEDFFLRYEIPTDCADAVYALRFIFARIRHLPQGVHSAYGTTFGNWRRDYDNLPRHEQWHRDKRFLRALRTVTNDFALVRCLVADAHPTRIWPEHGFLHAGTLLTSPDHAALVLSVDRSRFFPIQCVYSTLPPKTRSLIRVNYGDELTSRQEGFGVLNWNWWRVNADTGKYEMVPDEEMPGFSEEQYHPGIMLGDYRKHLLEPHFINGEIVHYRWADARFQPSLQGFRPVRAQTEPAVGCLLYSVNNEFHYLG